jgi:uncharacterized repeat protein (TIGR01451 family)
MYYEFDVINDGDTTLHNVRLADPLPQGTVPDDTVTWGGYYYDWVDGRYSLVWDLGDLAPGAAVKRCLELHTWGRDEPNYLVNTAYVYCDELPAVSSTHIEVYVECSAPGTPTGEPPATLTPSPTPTATSMLTATVTLTSTPTLAPTATLTPPPTVPTIPTIPVEPTVPVYRVFLPCVLKG